VRARTLAIAAVAGAALLVAAGIAAVQLLEPSRPVIVAGSPPAEPPGPAAAGLALPVGTPTWPQPTEEPAAPPPTHEPASPAVAQRGLVRPAVEKPATAGATPWESVETALRPAALGPDLAAPISDGLAEVRSGMQHCFDDEARRRAGERPSTRPGSGAATGPAVLTLRLEALEGRLSVAGADVASQGTASPALIECCRKALVGFEFPVPAVKPPERYKLTMMLM
jgi:hypothetical protein